MLHQLLHSLLLPRLSSLTSQRRSQLPQWAMAAEWISKESRLSIKEQARD
jgi:hypothetical protein